jgi:DNA polymerase
VPVSQAPGPDELESLWKTYYANIFNPARIKLGAMKKEMPKKHWPTLPETELIPQLLRQAPTRVQTMLAAAPKKESAANYLPQTIELPVLREAVQSCRGCELHCHATQAVFGEGPEHAEVMMIGEQPGDQEDLAGRPFVGPAGQVLDQALMQAGLNRSELYITNAVKHFKFEARGKRRIHSKPNAREMQACRPWLESEIHAVKPRIVVALGATAAQSLLGLGFRLTRERGIWRTDTPWAPLFIATYHPSALLRIPDPDQLAEAQAAFTADLKQVAQKLQELRNKNAASAINADAA